MQQRTLSLGGGDAQAAQRVLGQLDLASRQRAAELSSRLQAGAGGSRQRPVGEQLVEGLPQLLERGRVVHLGEDHQRGQVLDLLRERSRAHPLTTRLRPERLAS